MNKKIQRALSIALSGACVLSSIPYNVYAADIRQQILSNTGISVDIAEKQKIDLVLTKGESDIDLSTFKDDITNALKDQDIDVSNLNIQTIQTSEVDSNAFDAAEIFNNWGRVGLPGQWYLNTVSDKEGITKNALTNPENTNGLTGYYDPNAFNYSKIIFEFDQNAMSYTDDDIMGCFFRFNIDSQKSEDDVDKMCTSYAILGVRRDKHYDNHTEYNGLFKITNGNMKLFSGCAFSNKLDPEVELLQASPDVMWVRNDGANHFKRFRVEVVENNIKVYVQEWMNKKPLSDWKLAIDYTDNDNPIMTGSYGFFAHSQPYATYTNINVSLSDEKTFTQSLLDTTWRDDAHHIVVNVDDSIDPSFEDSQSYNEVLSRTANDDIHLIQWGSTDNESIMTEFIKDNNNQGIFLNDDDYNTLLNSTVDYIKGLLDSSENKNNTVLVGDTGLTVTPSDLASNTTNEQYPDGMWRVVHDPSYYDNSTGTYEYSGVYRDSLDLTFDKPGKYDIYYGTEFIKTVYANRLPVASFNSSIINENELELTSTSHDLDLNTDIGFGPGIVEEEWSYKKSDDDNFTIGKPQILDLDSDYIIRLRVKDKQGYWSNYYTQYITTKKVETNPVASFNFESPYISKFATPDLINNCYDPGNNEITQYNWSVSKDNKVIYTSNLSTFSVPDIDFSEFGAGEYSYKLSVKNSLDLTSSPIIRTLIVYDDTTAPQISINNNNRWLNTDRASIVLQDTESGLQRYKICVSESSIAPSDENEPTYSDWVSISGNKIEIPYEYTLSDGYIHIIAEDNSGNRNVTSQRLSIDTEAPEITGHTSYVDNTEFNGITNKNIKVEIEHNESGSGLGYIEYVLNGKTYKTYSNIIYLDETFNTPIEVVMYDNAGNKSNTYTISDIQIDKEVPIINVDGYTNPTNDESVNLNIELSDNMSTSVHGKYILSYADNTIFYDFDDSCEITLDQEGTYTLQVVAADDAGNTAYYSKIIIIDRTNPEIQSISINKQENNRVIHIEARDSLSGVSNIQYDIGDGYEEYNDETGIILSSDYSGDIQIKVIDNAGNELDYVLSNLEFEDEIPEISISNHIGWSNKPIDIVVTATDNSLIKNISWETDEQYNKQSGSEDIMPGLDGSLGGEASSELEYTIQLVNEGEYDLNVTVQDNSGNDVSAVRHIQIDTTNPTVHSTGVYDIEYDTEIVPVSIKNETETYTNKSGLKIGVQAFDSLSGVNGIEYMLVPLNSKSTDKNRIDDINKWIPVQDNLIIITQELTGYIKIRSTDNAGNQSEILSIPVCIDRTAPEIVITGNESGWSNGHPLLGIEVNDNSNSTISWGIDADGDGIPESIENIQSKPNEKHEISTDKPITGDINIVITVTDDAGNTSTIQVPIKIEDETSLVAPIVNTNGYTPGSIATGDISITASLPDGQTPDSGVSRYEYSTDGGNTWTEGFLNLEAGSGFKGEVIFRVVSNAGNISPESDPVQISMTSIVTVTFNSNGGTEISPIQLIAGDSLGAITNPTKSGYIFQGWYTDSSFNTKATSDMIISSDITLYAKWVKDSSGGSTGGSTGGNTGGNTGGSTGGSTGGNIGGNTGGSTGGNIGGNTGGSTGGNSSSNLDNKHNGEKLPGKDTDNHNYYLNEHIKLKEDSEDGYIYGYEDETFRPNNNLTRAEFAVILDRIFEFEDKGLNIHFDDIDNTWYSESIIRLANCGIVNGVGDNKFAPNTPITIDEVLIMLGRIVDMHDYSSKYNDWSKWMTSPVTDSTSFSPELVSQVLNSGIVEMRDKYNLSDYITREEMITFINNIIYSTLESDTDKFIFHDMFIEMDSFKDVYKATESDIE